VSISRDIIERGVNDTKQFHRIPSYTYAIDSNLKAGYGSHHSNISDGSANNGIIPNKSSLDLPNQRNNNNMDAGNSKNGHYNNNPVNTGSSNVSLSWPIHPTSDAGRYVRELIEETNDNNSKQKANKKSITSEQPLEKESHEKINKYNYMPENESYYISDSTLELKTKPPAANNTTNYNSGHPNKFSHRSISHSDHLNILHPHYLLPTNSYRKKIVSPEERKKNILTSLHRK
jgi:hypothetical protein